MTTTFLDYFSLHPLAPWLNFSLYSAIVIIAGVITQILIRTLYHKIRTPLSQDLRGQWKTLIGQALYYPLSTTLWTIIIIHISRFFMIDILHNKSGLHLVFQIQNIMILVLIAWSLSRFITLIVNKVENSTLTSKQVKHTINMAAIVTRTLLMLIIALIALDEVLGVSISRVAAYLGGGALIVGYAGKETIANFISTIVIFVDNPFTVGDWIRSPDRDIEGTVEYIGWRNTVIRTFDKRPLYVPNSIFTTISVETPSRMRNRRIKKIVGVRYADLAKLPKITEDINEFLLNHPDLDKRQTTFSALTQFAPSSLDILIYAFTKTREWVPFQQTQQEVLLGIAGIIDKHGAEIAFPTTTVDIPESVSDQLAKTLQTKPKSSTKPRSSTDQDA